jgi:phosphate transport system substrate-binding protein
MQYRVSAMILLGAMLVACGGETRTVAAEECGETAAPSGGIDLNGAGATFPYPIYSKWFADYAQACGIRINYQSKGSGAGVQQLSSNTVDFGASDGPMSNEEMTRAQGGPVLHFPTVLGGVVVIYNVPSVTTPLKLTGELIASIFMGRITKWNDSRIAAENPGVTLPAGDILVVHRSDGSGTTYVFTDYLAKVSPAWASGPGKGKEVKWPAGLGGQGNEGVAGQVKQTPGSIGYVELAYAKQNNLPAAHVKNAAGEYVAPSIESISAAADGAIAQLGPESDYRVSIVDAPGANAYPISSFTWLLVYETQADSVKGRKLVDFMRWMYTKGQESAASLDYSPLPAVLAQQLTARLTRIKLGAGT